MKKDIEYMLKPLLVLVVTLGVSLFVVIKGLAWIGDVKDKLDSAISTQNKLESKFETLSAVDHTLAINSTFLDVVLPSKGAVLYAINQVKNQSVLYNLAISGLKTGVSVPEKSDVYKTTISFEAEGEESSVYEFLASFSKLLPLMNVDKVSLNKSDVIVRASITLSVYSADLPKKIPSVSDPAKELSDSEIKLLQEVAKYQMPEFVEPETQQYQAVDADPFNL